MQLWSDMFNHSIRTWNTLHPHAERPRMPMMLENCHDGGLRIKPPAAAAGDPGSGRLPRSHHQTEEPDGWGSAGITPHYDAAGELWCPFHMYRSGGDNRPTWGAVLSHLNRTVAFAEANLSVPGCWAYAVRACV
jgi:hypothetical protein